MTEPFSGARPSPDAEQVVSTDADTASACLNRAGSFSFELRRKVFPDSLGRKLVPSPRTARRAFSPAVRRSRACR